MGDGSTHYCCCIEVDLYHNFCTLLTICRAYNEPFPSQRDILDASSNLRSCIKNSLKRGTTRSCTFKIEVRTDIFNYLFNGTGTHCSSKPGKMYNLNDFNTNYFNSDSFVYYNSQCEGVRVVFPVYMYSYVKFDPLSYSMSSSVLSSCPCNFSELVRVVLVKSRC